MSGDGLIGHTGFVGGILAGAHPFARRYNSANIEAIRGGAFDLLVCAGVSALKWKANKEPDADRAAIARLADSLGSVTAREAILISTIDVYEQPSAQADEDAMLDPSRNHSYGRHRRELEVWFTRHFPNARIVRLPMIFGTGLKKNVLFDLLHANLVEQINPATVLQWYPLRRLWQDIQTMREGNLSCINLFPPPIATAELIDAFFPDAAVGPPSFPALTYDLKSKHAARFGGCGGYILGAELVLGELARFVAAERRRLKAAS